MRKMKKDNKLFANYKFFLLSSFLLISCQTTPSYYEEMLVSGNWKSYEYIETASGTNAIIYQQRFYTDGTYSIDKQDPTSEDEHTFASYYYTLGYQSPKNAFILYKIEEEDSEGEDTPVYYEVGTPVYYYFDLNDFTLVTSTNSNMSRPRRWSRI